MSRPWRIEFERALYHVLSRGNEQQDIYLDNEDRNSAAANNVLTKYETEKMIKAVGDFGV